MPALEATTALSREQSLAIQGFMTKVYAWMCGGLGITAAIGFLLAQHPEIIAPIFQNKLYFFGIVLVELGLVIGLSAKASSLSAPAATAMYLLYSAVSGITFASIFLVYKMGSIGSVFVITAGMFGGMSLYGTVTKRDLSGWGSFLIMGVIGMIIAAVVNIWLQSPVLTWVVSGIGVIAFTGLTAYDTQKIRQLAIAGETFSQSIGISRHNAAIVGALTLYLDFINLFISLLQLFGDRR